MCSTELIQMQICNNFLPVPVLAEPPGKVSGMTERNESGEARESTTTVRVGFPTSETWDSRGGQNNVLGRTRARRRQSFRMFSAAVCLA